MIEEQYVSVETAKLAKEKGFNELCNSDYCKGLINYPHADNEYTNSQISEDGRISRPTQSLLARWLRENNRISVEYYFEKTSMDWFIAIVMMDEVCHTIYLSGFNTCEEAIEAGLKEALKII